jgi:hypothetical protein
MTTDADVIDVPKSSLSAVRVDPLCVDRRRVSGVSFDDFRVDDDRQRTTVGLGVR